MRALLIREGGIQTGNDLQRYCRPVADEAFAYAEAEHGVHG